LFVAQQMEDKWDIYLQDGDLYFTRSWTGELVFRAAIAFKNGEAMVSKVEANQAKIVEDTALAIRSVDFLVMTHLLRIEAPHPFRLDLPDDKRTLALYSFSEYGRWAFYGSFEDTTTVGVPADG
jgi:hypothetical protein